MDKNEFFGKLRNLLNEAPEDVTKDEIINVVNEKFPPQKEGNFLRNYIICILVPPFLSYIFYFKGDGIFHQYNPILVAILYLLFYFLIVIIPFYYGVIVEYDKQIKLIGIIASIIFIFTYYFILDDIVVSTLLDKWIRKDFLMFFVVPIVSYYVYMSSYWLSPLICGRGRLIDLGNSDNIYSVFHKVGFKIQDLVTIIDNVILYSIGCSEFNYKKIYETDEEDGAIIDIGDNNLLAISSKDDKLSFLVLRESGSKLSIQENNTKKDIEFVLREILHFEKLDEHDEGIIELNKKLIKEIYPKSLIPNVKEEVKKQAFQAIFMSGFVIGGVYILFTLPFKVIIINIFSGMFSAIFGFVFPYIFKKINRTRDIG